MSCIVFSESECPPNAPIAYTAFYAASATKRELHTSGMWRGRSRRENNIENKDVSVRPFLGEGHVRPLSRLHAAHNGGSPSGSTARH